MRGFPPQFMMMMPSFQPEPQQPQQPPENAVPVRVRVAMEFLSLLHHKEMKRGSIGEGIGNTLELDGIPPTDEERITSNAACEMLSKYFKGEMTMDPWETLRHQAIKKHVEKKSEEGLITPCPQCGMREGLPCKLCKGGGRVLISPLLASQAPPSSSILDDDDDDEATPPEPPASRRRKAPKATTNKPEKDMAPSIGMSEFARRQHQPGSGNSYSPELTETDIITLVHEGWDRREPGHGETTLDRKVVVPIAHASFFRVPFVPLHPELPVKARVVQRQAGEDWYVETYIDAYEAEKLGIEPKTAKSVKIVCYSAAALLENDGERCTDCDWEIVAILASDSDGSEPMRPLTMARNYLELPGGTKGEYTPKEFAEAIMYWSANKGIKIMKTEVP